MTKRSRPNNEIDDIGSEVMKSVVKWERRRGWVWFVFFLAALTMLVVIAYYEGFVSGKIIRERRTVDMLELWGEDRETIEIYWRDVVATIWEELPRQELAIGVLALSGAILIVLVTKNKRKVIGQKTKEMIQYSSRKKLKGK